MIRHNNLSSLWFKTEGESSKWFIMIVWAWFIVIVMSGLIHKMQFNVFYQECVKIKNDVLDVGQLKIGLGDFASKMKSKFCLKLNEMQIFLILGILNSELLKARHHR